MFRNINITFRRLWRKKSFSLLNIMGLSVGIAASLQIFLLIRYELSIDRFHLKQDRIYRVVCTETFGNGVTEFDGCSPIQLPDALRSEFPGIEKVAATMRMGTQSFTLPSSDESKDSQGKEKKVQASDVYFSDPSLFSIFDFPWLAGNPEQALQEPYTAAITRSVAENWFVHWQNAIGKLILLGDDRVPYRITGILKDPPPNTDLAMKVILSYATFRIIQGKEMSAPGDWDNFNTSSQCFFLLSDKKMKQSVDAMLPGFVHRHFSPLYAASHVKDSCFFQPLREMHFNTQISRYGKDGWSYSDGGNKGITVPII